MVKINLALLNKNNFIPIYGCNRSEKNGRRLEKNAPTLSDLAKEKLKNNETELKLNCEKEIDEVIKCFKTNGKENLNSCANSLNNLKNCYSHSYDRAFAFKVYDSQVKFILNNI